MVRSDTRGESFGGETIMGHIQELVVGVDGSDEALDAVKWAGARASASGARLRIVCAYAIASYSAAALDGGLAVLDDNALRIGAERVDARQPPERRFWSLSPSPRAVDGFSPTRRAYGHSCTCRCYSRRVPPSAPQS